MAKLGSFGAVQKTVDSAQGKKREPDTFDFYGEKFTVVQAVPSALPLMQFAAAMAAADEDDASINMEALGAMYNMLRYCLPPAEWPRFEKLAMKNGAGVEELLPITQAVWESVNKSDPTEGPSSSPGGPSTTSHSSKDDSRSRKDRRAGKKGRRTAGSSAPDVSRLRPANEWTPPSNRPDLAVVLTPVDDLSA